MFAEVRRKSYQKSFSLKINAPFLNTQNGETDVCGGSGGNVFTTSATYRFLNYRLTIHSQTTLAQMRILRIPKIVGYYIIC